MHQYQNTAAVDTTMYRCDRIITSKLRDQNEVDDEDINTTRPRGGGRRRRFSINKTFYRIPSTHDETALIYISHQFFPFLIRRANQGNNRRSQCSLIVLGPSRDWTLSSTGVAFSRQQAVRSLICVIFSVLRLERGTS